jgi:hypothetical protein
MFGNIIQSLRNACAVACDLKCDPLHRIYPRAHWHALAQDYAWFPGTLPVLVGMKEK